MAEIRLDAQSLKYMVTRYAGKPLLFAKEILKRDCDTWQVDALNATALPINRRISRSAGHSVGKSWFAAILALHRLCTLAEAQTIVTSATYAQLMTRLFPTIIKLIQGSMIPNWFDCTSETVKLKGLSSNWIKAQPWNKSNSESFAGLHVTSPCLIADEASAIDDTVFEAFEGSMQHANSLLVMLGNPLYRTGALFDSGNGKRNLYNYANISCLDSKYTSPIWIKEMADTYGADSDVYRVRVLGEFPQSETEGFIREADIKAAVNRQTVPTNESIVGGLDVARYGSDASVLYLRQGNRSHMLKRWHQRDPMDVCEEVSQIINEHGVALVAVDAHGVGGPVADRLRKLQPSKIIDINLSADGGRQYYNRRTALWGASRDWIKYGSIPDDKDLIASGSSLLYTYDNKGRFQLESKDLAKKRGVHSPDAWDALSYSFGITVPPKGTSSAKYVPQTMNISCF